jgi:hypothetical protein
VRAASALVLEHAAAEGHTVIGEPTLRMRLSGLPLKAICDPVSDMFDIAANRFAPVLSETPLARDQGRGWQLGRLASFSDVIAVEVGRRIEAGPLDVTWEWRERIDQSATRKPRRQAGVSSRGARRAGRGRLSTFQYRSAEDDRTPPGVPAVGTDGGTGSPLRPRDPQAPRLIARSSGRTPGASLFGDIRKAPSAGQWAVTHGAPNGTERLPPSLGGMRDRKIGCIH